MSRRWIGILIFIMVVQSGCLFITRNDQPTDVIPQEGLTEGEPVTPVDTPVVESTATPIPTATPQLSSEPAETPSPIPTNTPEPSPTLSPGDLELIQMNFEDASLREILIYLAELAGWDYLISPEVGSGSVTLRTTKPFRKVDVEKVLYSILDMNNLAIVNGPETSEGKPAFKKIIPKPDAKHSPITTRKGKDLSRIPQEDVLVTQIVATEFVSPDDILNVIRPLISPDATIITHSGANMMIITDTSSNIRRLLDIVQLLDQETALYELEIYQIKYGDVQDIQSVLDRVLGARVSLGGAAGIQAAGGAKAKKPPGVPAKTGGAEVNAIMIPDTRSNSLIVFALRKDLEFIREIISILDVDIYVNKKAYIYYVENAIASELSGLLEAVFTGRDDSPGGSTRRTTAPGRKTTQPAANPAGVTTIGGAADLQGDVSIVADERTNALIIVTAPVNYPYIVETIKMLDIMPKQVLIEVLIADVTLDQNSEFGITWDLRSEGSLDIGGDRYNFDAISSQTVGGPGSGFVYELFEADRFKALISAKANENKLEILSSPHVVVANNQEATIDVGSDVPVVTSEADAGTDASGRRQYNRTIEYRKTGILLRVVPHINSAHFVNLEISQEVSNISETALEGINSPIIETRKATTAVMVGDSQTLVIGGLIQRSKNPSREGVPWFYRIPILKYLFGKHKYSERASELLIFLTPYVVNSPEDAYDLSEQLKNKININKSFYEDFIGMEPQKEQRRSKE